MALFTQLFASARVSLKRLWAPRTSSPDFTVALGQWLLVEGALTFNQLKYVCGYARSSWVRSALLLAADAKSQSDDVKRLLSRVAVIDQIADPAIAGAVMSGRCGERPLVSVSQMRRQAALVLKEFGLVRRAGGRVCGVNSSLSMLIGQAVSFNWRSFFGKTYRHAERQLVSCRGYANTDATAWVQGLDVFNDWLLDALFRHEPTLGGYSLGNIGACTGSPSNAIKVKFPHVLALVTEVHNQRYRSDLAHPKVKATQRPTGRIPFKFIVKTKRLVAKAIGELVNAGLV